MGVCTGMSDLWCVQVTDAHGCRPECSDRGRNYRKVRGAAQFAGAGADYALPAFPRRTGAGTPQPAATGFY